MSYLAIIDDDANIRAIMTQMLELAGYTVEAGDGTPMLARMRDAPPRLLFLDVMMPGVSGLDVAQAMRADPVLAAVPIIVVTAFLYPQARVAAMGGAALLAKPFGMEELIALAREHAPQEETTDGDR